MPPKDQSDSVGFNDAELEKVTQVIDDIIKEAAQEHEEFLQRKYYSRTPKDCPKLSPQCNEFIVPKTERFEDDLKDYEVAVKKTLNTSPEVNFSQQTEQNDGTAPPVTGFEDQFLSFITLSQTKIKKETKLKSPSGGDTVKRVVVHDVKIEPQVSDVDLLLNQSIKDKSEEIKKILGNDGLLAASAQSKLVKVTTDSPLKKIRKPKMHKTTCVLLPGTSKTASNSNIIAGGSSSKLNGNILEVNASPGNSYNPNVYQNRNPSNKMQIFVQNSDNIPQIHITENELGVQKVENIIYLQNLDLQRNQQKNVQGNGVYNLQLVQGSPNLYLQQQGVQNPNLHVTPQVNLQNSKDQSSLGQFINANNIANEVQNLGKQIYGSQVHSAPSTSQTHNLKPTNLVHKTYSNPRNQINNQNNFSCYSPTNHPNMLSHNFPVNKNNNISQSPGNNCNNFNTSPPRNFTSPSNQNNILNTLSPSGASLNNFSNLIQQNQAKNSFETHAFSFAQIQKGSSPIQNNSSVPSSNQSINLCKSSLNNIDRQQDSNFTQKNASVLNYPSPNQNTMTIASNHGLLSPTTQNQTNCSQQNNNLAQNQENSHTPNISPSKSNGKAEGKNHCDQQLSPRTYVNPSHNRSDAEYTVMNDISIIQSGSKESKAINNPQNTSTPISTGNNQSPSQSSPKSDTSTPSSTPPAPPKQVKPRKPNLIWANHKYFSINTCNVEFDNSERFYPMSMNPIDLKMSSCSGQKENHVNDVEFQLRNFRNIDNKDKKIPTENPDDDKRKLKEESEFKLLKEFNGVFTISPKKEPTEEKRMNPESPSNIPICLRNCVEKVELVYNDVNKENIQNEKEENRNDSADIGNVEMDNSNKENISKFDCDDFSENNCDTTDSKRDESTIDGTTDEDSNCSSSSNSLNFKTMKTIPFKPKTKPLMIRRRYRRKMPWYDKAHRQYVILKKLHNEKLRSQQIKLNDKIRTLTPRSLSIQLNDIFNRLPPPIQKKLSSKISVKMYPSARRPGDDGIEEQLTISAKDKVWAKKSNGRFYKAQVLSTRNVTLYCVYITEDSSFVQDLTSDNIVSCCDKLIVGDKMMVKFGTDDLYQGEFVAEKIQLFCTVMFEDNTTIEVASDSIILSSDFVLKT